MAVAGQGDPLGIHGAIVLLAGIAGTFGVISGYYEPEPGDDRLDRYFDDPSRMGIILAMVWSCRHFLSATGSRGNSPIRT